MKRPTREERRKAARREVRGDPRKSHEDCPIELAIDARRPPEARLSPFPQDDLVETPAPRPSLAPFGVEEKPAISIVRGSSRGERASKVVGANGARSGRGSGPDVTGVREHG